MVRDKKLKRTIQFDTDLRQQAEESVRESLVDVTVMTDDEIGRVLYESQVHQVELELQNEQLRNANQELLSSHERLADLYKFALANLNEGVLITTKHNGWLESRVIFANDAVCKYLDCTFGEIYGRTPERLLSELIDVSALAQITDQINSTGEFQGNLDYKSDDGGVGEIELSVLPLTSADSQGVYFVAVLRDSTARKRHELALHERKELLQAIQDAVLDVIITIDRKGVIQDCNSAVENVFGYAPAELLGCNVSLLMPAAYRRSHDDYLRQYLETGESYVIGKSRELSALHRDGRIFPITLSVSEVDHLGFYTGVISDISELKKLQREVLLAAGEVRWRIGQALHDGPQQALVGLSLMARGMAMDLEKQSSPLAADAKALSQRLMEENKHIRLLGRGLIPVPIGDRGLIVALTSLANQVVAEFEIDCHFECTEPVDIADHYVVDQLYHIAREAVLNATKHSGADHIGIYLGRHERAISLIVEDNGSGLLKAEHERQGLGLHIMPYRAATIGASLSVSDRVEGGVVVTCTLIQPGTTTKA